MNPLPEDMPAWYGIIPDPRETDYYHPFDGWHKVGSYQGGGCKHVILYDGEQERDIIVDDCEYPYDEGPLMGHTHDEYPDLDVARLEDAPTEPEWRMKWILAHGRPYIGMRAVIVKGRYEGGKGVIEELQPIRDRYGRTVAWYARLDDGTRTNIANLQPEEETL